MPPYGHNVKASDAMPLATSSHVTGIETGKPGRARGEQAPTSFLSHCGRFCQTTRQEEKARCDHRCLSTAALAAIAAVLSETFPPLNDAIS
jgi:hypothetical protein